MHRQVNSFRRTVSSKRTERQCGSIRSSVCVDSTFPSNDHRERCSHCSKRDPHSQLPGSRSRGGGSRHAGGRGRRRSLSLCDLRHAGRESSWRENVHQSPASHGGMRRKDAPATPDPVHLAVAVSVQVGGAASVPFAARMKASMVLPSAGCGLGSARSPSPAKGIHARG